MSSPLLETYQYEPLPSGQPAIRLLRLVEQPIGDVAYEIRWFTSENAPQYTVLSYVWGDNSRVHQIQANGKCILITENLKVFFDETKRRRNSQPNPSTWPFGWLWVDAVCINQEDSNERSEQVAMMKAIFEKAHSLIMWLGEESNEVADAVEYIRNIASLKTSEPSLSEVIGTELCRFGSENSFLDISPSDIETVKIFFENVYWKRIWNVQEASTPNDSTVICCGSQNISWASVRLANRLLQAGIDRNTCKHLLDLRIIQNPKVDVLAELFEIRRDGTTSKSLLEILVRFRDLDSTDPRDKLYSILGLASNAERVHRDLQPDYALPVSLIYTRLAATIIRLTNSLDVLGSAGLLRNHDVPSWVPDWTVTYESYAFPLSTHLRTLNPATKAWDRSDRPLYATDRHTAPYIRFSTPSAAPASSPPSPPSMPTRLTLRGVLFDTLTRVSSPRRYDEDPAHQTADWTSWVSVARPDATPYVAGGTRREAFALMLRADRLEIYDDLSASRGADARWLDSFGEGAQGEGGVGNVFLGWETIVDEGTYDRCCFVTERGYLGMVNAGAREGDSVIVAFGSQYPLVLRKEGGGERESWVCVGRAYIQGIMDGEGLEGVDIEKKARYFVID